MTDKITTIELLNEMHERCLMPTASDPKRFDKAKALEVAIKALEYEQRDREMKSAIHCYRCCGYKEWKNDK